MKKRIVSALLALVLILSNFTGGGLIEHVHVEAADVTDASLQLSLIVQESVNPWTTFETDTAARAYPSYGNDEAIQLSPESGWLKAKVQAAGRDWNTVIQNRPNVSIQVYDHSGLLADPVGNQVGDISDEAALVIFEYTDIVLSAEGYDSVTVPGKKVVDTWRTYIDIYNGVDGRKYSINIADAIYSALGNDAAKTFDFLDKCSVKFNFNLQNFIKSDVQTKTISGNFSQKFSQIGWAVGSGSYWDGILESSEGITHSEEYGLHYINIYNAVAKEVDPSTITGIKVTVNVLTENACNEWQSTGGENSGTAKPKFELHWGNISWDHVKGSGEFTPDVTTLTASGVVSSAANTTNEIVIKLNDFDIAHERIDFSYTAEISYVNTEVPDPEPEPEPVPKPVAPEGYEIVYELDMTSANITPGHQGVNGDNAAIAEALQKDGAYVEFITCYPGANSGWIQIDFENGEYIQYNNYNTEIRTEMAGTDRTSIVRLPNGAVLDAIKQAEEKSTTIKGISLAAANYEPKTEADTARENKCLGLFIYAKIPGDTPDLPTCEGHDDTWTVIENPEKSEPEPNGTDFKIKLANGDKVYNGDTLELHVLGTADVEGKSNPGIRLYVSSGSGYSNNNLTAGNYYTATIENGIFEFDTTVNVGDGANAGVKDSAGDSIIFKPNGGGYTSAEITHFAYKITHNHTAGGYAYDGKYHWKACSVCGKPVGDTKEEHNFADGSLKCSGCGYTHLENEVALDLKAAAAVNANAITFDEDGNAYIKAGAIGPGGVVSFDLGRNLELGQEVTFHILASVYGNAQARLWLMQGTTVDRISDITVLTDKEHKDNLYDFTVNIPVKDAENQGRTSAGSIAFKGIDNNVNFPEMTIYHIGVVYPGCEHPADKQVTQFDLKNHWKRCLVCNEIIKDTTTAHTMVDNKCSGCAFEHYPDEVAIELTDENINSGNDGAITYEEGAVKVASNSVEWMNFNIGRTLLVGEKISVHIIGNIVAGSANQNGYLRAWLGDSGNKSEQCTDINKTSDGTFYNGYFQVKREFECTASTNAVALKANDYNTKLPELVIEHVAVVVPKCPHYTDSPNHDAWLAGNYTEYTIASSVPGKYGCHDLVCTLCGEIIETEQHTPNEDGYKDTGDGENHTYTCVCGSVITGTHREGTEIEYGNDDTNHWSLCADCGGKIDSTVAEHVLTYKDNGDGSTHTATCDTCGYKNESEAHVESQNKYDEDDVGRYHVCEYCNARLDKTEHHYVFVDDKNGTTHHEECETCHHKKAGSTEEHDYKDGKCSKCDYNHPEDEHVWSSWTPDLGGTTHTRTCSICGKEDTDPHNLPEEWTPSSEDETKHLKKCPDCGYEVTGEHNFGDSYEYVDAETHMQTCADCKKTVTSSHNYEEGKYSNSTTDHWQICKDCKGESDRENHKYVDGSDRCSVCNYWNHQHTLEWKDDGENHWQECSNPDCDYKTEKEPHVLGDSYDYNTTQHSRTCSVCHAKISKDHDLVDKYDNDFHWQGCEVCDYETRPVRHTLKTDSDENGHWEYCENCKYKSDPVAHTPEKELGHDAESHWSICSECGEVYNKTAHTPSDELKHDSEGHWTVCSVCGYESTEKNEHTWDDGEITVEPTETTEGVKTYTCTECGETKTESVPKSAHVHVAGEEWKHDEKTHWHECVSETCDDKSAKLDEAAHTEDEGTVTKAATETEEGVMTYKCTVCGAVTRTESIPKVTHTHVAGKDWKHDEKTHWHECVSETCDDKTAKLDEAEHVWDDGKVTVEPTYTKEGEKLYTCEVCGETMTETVPVKGHEHSTVTKSDENGHWEECTICGEIVGKVEAHTPGEWITDSEATSTEAGKRHKECTVCGYVTDVLEVPATGDIAVEVPTVGNVPKVELPAEQQEVLKNAIIDEEDVEAIENGASIDIELTVENAESTIAPEDKAKSDEAAAQGSYTHVRYLDINLAKVVTDASGVSTSEEVSELGKEVRIVITVPLGLARQSGRDFAVIRVHDGEATVLKDLDSDPNTVTISTNLFSSYTLVYVDTTPVPSTPGGMIGHAHVITGLQNDAHYHWRGCFICSMRVDYEPHRFVDGVCTVCHYRDSDYVPEVEEEEPAEAPDTEVTVVDAPAEGTEQGGDSEGTPEVTDTPADLPETEAEVVEVKEDDVTSENPKTGVVFTGIGAVMAALAALVAKRK